MADTATEEVSTSPVDRHLSREIHSFLDWVEYPRGHEVLPSLSDEVINDVVVSSDGHRAFTAANGGHITVLDLTQNTQIHDWIADDKAVIRLACHSGLMVSGGADSNVNVWDEYTYALIHTLEGHTKPVITVDIKYDKSDDQKMVLSGSLDWSIMIWSMKTGRCICKLNGHTQGVTTVMFLGSLVISGSHDQSLKLWNPDLTMDKSSKLLRSVSDDYSLITWIGMNCDYTLLAFVSFFSWKVFQWPDLDTPFQSKVGACHSGAFHPRKPYLFAINDLSHDSIVRNENPINIYDLSKDCKRIVSLKGHKVLVSGLSFTPDGSRLVSTSHDHTTRVWDVSYFL